MSNNFNRNTSSLLPHFEKEKFEINLAATLKFANKMRTGLQSELIEYLNNPDKFDLILKPKNVRHETIDQNDMYHSKKVVLLYKKVLYQDNNFTSLVNACQRSICL